VSAQPTPTASPAELVAGFLAVISIAGSILAIVWDPLRISPFAILLALISVGMSPRGTRLPLLAVVVGTICFFAGLTVAATMGNALY
jgi:hypothetical protein